MGWDAIEQNLIGKWQPWVKGLPVLGVIWLVSSGCDRLWLALDRSIPSWDAADYLAGAMNYWHALQTPQWFSGHWWTNFWLLSSKIPPLVYISTAPFIAGFGGEPDQAILVFLLYSAILLASVYSLGTYLFNVRVGLWAAGLCVLMPTLYQSRLEFLLDYPLTAIVTLAFLSLTIWRCESNHPAPKPVSTVSDRAPQEPEAGPTWQRWLKESAPEDDLKAAPLDAFKPLLTVLLRLKTWLLAIAFGLSLGLGLMTKQPALFFLLVPMLWLIGESLRHRQWIRLAQFGLALLASLLVWFPWYRTNWLLILTSSKRATIDSAIIEGDPSLLSLNAWTLYLSRLPNMVSWPLLIAPLLGLLLFWRRSRVSSQWFDKADYEPKPHTYRQQVFVASRKALGWLLVFMVGAYILSTLNPNKAERYVAPYLPVLAVILAYGLTLLPRSWRLFKWGSVALAGVLMLTALFPLFPNAQTNTALAPYQGAEYPHAAVINEVVQAEPYLRSTIGVLPSTPAINQHNINYYGLLAKFQVYGRQVGTREAYLEQDRRSLPWFLTKTGDQGSLRRPELQAALVQAVEQQGEFKLQKSWPLPDGSTLNLYHRATPIVSVNPAPTGTTATAPIQLTALTIPAQAPPGQPVPVTYQWSGPWQALRSGLVILTWRRQTPTDQKGAQRWFHDHGIALGELQPESPPNGTETSPFQVTERLAMLPPKDLVPGRYRLDAAYLNRQTGQTQAIAVPTVTLEITPEATATPAPELDLVTQLRRLASTLPQGTPALTEISNEISRINQYDPIQDYLKQAQQATTYRLEREPKNRQLAYTLALAQVLDRQVDPAIAALQRVTQLDPANPYAYAYLAFVNLYDFRPGKAQLALDQALQQNANVPELHALSAIAGLMRGNLVHAWQEFQTYQKLQVTPTG